MLHERQAKKLVTLSEVQIPDDDASTTTYDSTVVRHRISRPSPCSYDVGSLMAAALARSPGDVAAASDVSSSLRLSQVDDGPRGRLTTSVPLLGSSGDSMVGLSHSLPRSSPPMVQDFSDSDSVLSPLRSMPRPSLPTAWTPDHHESISVRSHHYLEAAKPFSDSLESEAQELMASGLPFSEYMFILMSSAVCASSLSFLVDEFGELSSRFRQFDKEKAGQIVDYFGGSTRSSKFSQTLGLVLMNTLTCVIARLLVRTTAQAEGSGIPEVKTMLFGQVKMVKEFLKLRVLFVKSVSLALIVAAGMPIGKEGPFVHFASCITANIYPNFFAKTAGAVFPFLLASVAVGVGTTFSAPLGGVIFALELMLPQVYDMTSYLGCFVASVIGSIVFTVLKTQVAVYKSNSKSGLVALMSSDVTPGQGVSGHPIIEIGMNMILGLICGVMGGTFIKLHTWTQKKLKEWRIRGQATSKPGKGVVDSSKNAGLRKALLRPDANEGQSSWAEESNKSIEREGCCSSFWARISKRCGGWIWRDIFQVGLVALINSVLVENIALLSKCTTMPQLLIQLFGKDFHTNMDPITIPYVGVIDSKEVIMLTVFLVKWTMTILALALPTPTGVVAPTMVLGAIIGQCFYLILPEWFLEFYLENKGEEGQPIPDIEKGALAARFAIVGAAAFCSAVTRAFSMAITVFEVLALPGSVLPLSCASLLAMYAAERISPSFFDEILRNKGFYGIWAMSSSAKSMLPASKVMSRYTDYHTNCLSHRCCLRDLDRILKESRKNSFPIVQRVRDHSGLEDFTAETREWDLPLLVGTVGRHLVEEVLVKFGQNPNPHTMIDFLDPNQFTEEQVRSVMRTPLHVDANTAVKDVFLLWKVMNTSAETEPIVYVTDKGHLLGVIRGEELVGKEG